MATFYRADGWVKTVQGPAVAGAQIYVCTQPANPVIPPSPLAAIFSDPAGLVPITQPVVTDGFGHYDFYALPGIYTVVVSFGGRVQQVYADQSLGNVGTSTGTSALFETNGSPNFNQNLLNLVQGAGIILATDNFGNTTIVNTNPTPTPPSPPTVLETNGVANGSQALLNLKDGSGIGIVDDGVGGVTISSTATGGILTAQLTLTPTQMRAGISTKYTILGESLGKNIFVFGFSAKMNPFTIGWTNTVIANLTEYAVGGNLALSVLNLNTNTSHQFFYNSGVGGGIILTDTVGQGGLYIAIDDASDGGNPTADGSVTFTVFYQYI